MELDKEEGEKPADDGLAAKAIRALGTIKLQGKEYLQVAHRIFIFRMEHPKASIRTQFTTVGETTVAQCLISENNEVLAQAHKSVQIGGKGPAAKYPLEMAETGAIGRALGLCGYGTLSGDLDEGDQIADAPQSTGGKRSW